MRYFKRGSATADAEVVDGKWECLAAAKERCTKGSGRTLEASSSAVHMPPSVREGRPL